MDGDLNSLPQCNPTGPPGYVLREGAPAAACAATTALLFFGAGLIRANACMSVHAGNYTSRLLWGDTLRGTH